MKHKLKLALILGVEFVAIAIVLILIFFSGKKQYTVVFDLNGGILISGDLEQHVTQGHSATPPTVVKDGQYLQGWSGNYRDVTHDVKVSAIWEYVTTDGIEYSQPSGATYTEISGCYKYLPGKVYVGAYRNNLKVLSIKDSSFENCSKITELHLLDGILYIGKRAFAGCSEMTVLELPDTAIKIDDEAFYGCSNLESITLPEKLEELGARAFMGCSSLTEVRIPSTVKLIDQSAFEGCENLKNVTFYDVEEEKDIFADETEDVESNVSVEPTLVISAYAFQNCTALESINLPKTLHTLQTYAFSGCTSLKTVIIPKGTVMIANSVFDAGSPRIYVYEDSKPQGWASNWVSGNATVSYGYNGEDISAPDDEATD